MPGSGYEDCGDCAKLVLRRPFETSGTMQAIFWLIVIPILCWILYWGVRLTSWLFRVAFISTLILIHLAGRAWRGEL